MARTCRQIRRQNTRRGSTRPEIFRRCHLDRSWIEAWSAYGWRRSCRRHTRICRQIRAQVMSGIIRSIGRGARFAPRTRTRSRPRTRTIPSGGTIPTTGSPFAALAARTNILVAWTIRTATLAAAIAILAATGTAAIVVAPLAATTELTPLPFRTRTLRALTTRCPITSRPIASRPITRQPITRRPIAI